MEYTTTVESVKIVYLHQYFTTPSMAGGTRSFEAARRLVEWGHEVTMITSWRSGGKGSDWFITDENGIEVHWVPLAYSNEMGFTKRVIVFLRFAAASARRAASIDAHIIFASSTPLTIVLPALYASWRRKIPYVFEVRDLWPEIPIAMGFLANPFARAAAKLLERIAYKYASRVVALSPGMAEGVSRTGYPPERISVIPNGSDLSVFAPNREAAAEFIAKNSVLAGRPFLLYPGTIGIANGVDYLVRLALAIDRVGLDLNIVVLGEGGELEEVRSLAIDLEVFGRIFHILPPVPKNRLAGAMSAASGILSVFIDLPELEANSANKFFDALASGSPIFINYGGWQKQLIEEYQVGLVLCRDEEKATKQLVTWFEQSTNATEVGQAARQLAKTMFSRDDLIRKLENVLLDSREP